MIEEIILWFTRILSLVVLAYFLYGLFTFFIWAWDRLGWKYLASDDNEKYQKHIYKTPRGFVRVKNRWDRYPKFMDTHYHD